MRKDMWRSISGFDTEEEAKIALKDLVEWISFTTWSKVHSGVDKTVFGTYRAWVEAQHEET